MPRGKEKKRKRDQAARDGIMPHMYHASHGSNGRAFKVEVNSTSTPRPWQACKGAIHMLLDSEAHAFFIIIGGALARSVEWYRGQLNPKRRAITCAKTKLPQPSTYNGVVKAIAREMISTAKLVIPKEVDLINNQPTWDKLRCTHEHDKCQLHIGTSSVCLAVLAQEGASVQFQSYEACANLSEGDMLIFSANQQWEMLPPPQCGDAMSDQLSAPYVVSLGHNDATRKTIEASFDDVKQQAQMFLDQESCVEANLQEQLHKQGKECKPLLEHDEELGVEKSFVVVQEKKAATKGDIATEQAPQADYVDVGTHGAVDAKSDIPRRDVRGTVQIRILLAKVSRVLILNTPHSSHGEMRRARCIEQMRSPSCVFGKDTQHTFVDTEAQEDVRLLTTLVDPKHNRHGAVIGNMKGWISMLRRAVQLPGAEFKSGVVLGEDDLDMEHVCDMGVVLAGQPAQNLSGRRYRNMHGSVVKEGRPEGVTAVLFYTAEAVQTVLTYLLSVRNYAGTSDHHINHTEMSGVVCPEQSLRERDGSQFTSRVAVDCAARPYLKACRCVEEGPAPGPSGSEDSDDTRLDKRIRKPVAPAPKKRSGNAHGRVTPMPIPKQNRKAAADETFVVVQEKKAATNFHESEKLLGDTQTTPPEAEHTKDASPREDSLSTRTCMSEAPSVNNAQRNISVEEWTTNAAAKKVQVTETNTPATGWTRVAKLRTDGSRYDVYYYTPANKQLRSLNDVKKWQAVQVMQEDQIKIGMFCFKQLARHLPLANKIPRECAHADTTDTKVAHARLPNFFACYF